MHNGTTITQFIIEEQRRVSGATGDFTSLLNDVVTACKVISN
ncbi:MAG TPA: class 1 fructose-bisphosphatase, partial [Chromatiaceae bacterium]|nr:class 1 fructose-bisphosphatase [Chromatiaceae bacterium]